MEFVRDLKENKITVEEVLAADEKKPERPVFGGGCPGSRMRTPNRITAPAPEAAGSVIFPSA